MPTAYSPLLGLALPVTGELAGTWGDTVNNYITTYLDSSVAGTQTISGSQTAVTLSVTNGTTLTQVGSGATGSAQYNIINCTGNPASLLTITAPAASKTYLIINATSTSQSVKIVGTGPTTGVTLIAGEKALVAWNGSDFIKVATTAAAAGSNTQVQYNSGGNLAGSANLTFDGTGLTIGAAASASTRLTVNGPVQFNASTDTNTYVTLQNTAYLTASGSLVFGANSAEGMRLTSTGLGIGTSSPSSKLHVSGTGTVIQKLASISGAVELQLIANTQTNASYSNIYSGDGTNWNWGIGGSNGTSNTMTFSTGGTERARITSGGDFGLGTTTPTNSAGYSTLSLNGSTGGQLVFQTGGTYKQSIYSSSTDLNFYNSVAGNLTFSTNSTERARITSGGNLLVGTTSATGARIDSQGSVAGALEVFNGQNTSADGAAITRLTLASQGGNWYIENQRTGAPLCFNNGSERARITSGGNLLVGTTTDPGGSGKICDANGNVRAIPQSGAAKTGSYTLATTDVGEYILISTGGSIVIPNSTFASGDVVSLFNNTTGSITITCSTTNAYIAGTDTNKTSMTLATRGVATILFITSTLCVVSGNVT